MQLTDALKSTWIRPTSLKRPNGILKVWPTSPVLCRHSSFIMLSLCCHSRP